MPVLTCFRERVRLETLVREAKVRFGIPAALVAAMWVVAATDFVLPAALSSFGIRPRTPSGLLGIVFAPFLHANLAHLIANSVPFLVLGCMVALRGVQQFVLVTAWIAVAGGGAVWLLGRPFSVHVGASGIVFGYLGFLLARGLFERSFQAILLSLLTLFLYGGAIWGILPGSAYVSWESHLFGFLAGIAAGRFLGLPKRKVRL